MTQTVYELRVAEPEEDVDATLVAERGDGGISAVARCVRDLREQRRGGRVARLHLEREGEVAREVVMTGVYGH